MMPKKGVKHLYEQIFIGQKFGKWTVIKYRGLKKSHPYWRCQCECGVFKEITSQTLVRGKSTKCKKCSGIDHRVDDVYITTNKVASDYKYIAKKRNLSFNLTRDDIKNLIFQLCFYCGNLPRNVMKDFSKYESEVRQVMYNGIDRVDNSLGYNLENCVPCCHICNMAKRTLTLEQFKDWINQVYTNLAKKNI